MIPRWSVVTVTYNSVAALKTYASRISSSNVEWIVVDNASDDGSASFAESLGARVIALPENVGFARANNIGISAARGGIVACVNPDVRLPLADLDGIEARLMGTGVPVLYAPQLINPDGSLQPNGRGVPSLARKVRNRISGADSPGYQLFSRYGEMKYVGWLTGAVVIATRETWAALNGWDEAYFVYYEDQDLSLRAWMSGKPVVIDGKYRWVHGWARETARGVRFKPWVYEFRGMAVFYRRFPGLLFSHRLVPRSLGHLKRTVGRELEIS